MGPLSNTSQTNRAFSNAHFENKKDRFFLVDFKQWKSLTGPKLKASVDDLNEVLKNSGQVFVNRVSKKSNQRARRLYGYARVEILKPGGHYRDAKLKILVSDDKKILDPSSKVYPQRIKEMEFTTQYFDKVKIFSYAEHKLRTAEHYFSPNETYTPPDEQLYAPIGSDIDPNSAPKRANYEFPELFSDLPFFDDEQ